MYVCGIHTLAGFFGGGVRRPGTRTTVFFAGEIARLVLDVYDSKSLSLFWSVYVYPGLYTKITNINCYLYTMYVHILYVCFTVARVACTPEYARILLRTSMVRVNGFYNRSILGVSGVFCAPPPSQCCFYGVLLCVSFVFV